MKNDILIATDHPRDRAKSPEDYLPLAEWGIAIGILAFAARQLWLRLQTDDKKEAALTAGLIADVREREAKLLERLLGDARIHNEMLSKQQLEASKTMLEASRQHLALFDEHMQLMRLMNAELRNIRDCNAEGFDKLDEDLKQ